jgi:hypothetical protein
MQVQSRVHPGVASVLHDIRQSLYSAFVPVTEGNGLFLGIYIFLIRHQDRYLCAELRQFKWTW